MGHADVQAEAACANAQTGHRQVDAVAPQFTTDGASKRYHNVGVDARHHRAAMRALHIAQSLGTGSLPARRLLQVPWGGRLPPGDPSGDDTLVNALNSLFGGALGAFQRRGRAGSSSTGPLVPVLQPLATGAGGAPPPGTRSSSGFVGQGGARAGASLNLAVRFVSGDGQRPRLPLPPRGFTVIAVPDSSSGGSGSSGSSRPTTGSSRQQGTAAAGYCDGSSSISGLVYRNQTVMCSGLDAGVDYLVTLIDRGACGVHNSMHDMYVLQQGAVQCNAVATRDCCSCCVPGMLLLWDGCGAA